MDACGDPDPRLDCASYTRLALDEDGCFSPAPLLDAVRRLGRQQPGIRLCYGSGFEARPGLLSALGQWLALLGNHPDTVARCQNPALSRTVLRPLAIPHPETRNAGDCPSSASSGAWLIKRIGGAGGGHVRRLDGRSAPHPARDYLQRYAAGEPLSVVFAADGRDFRILGFNRQYNGRQYNGRQYNERQYNQYNGAGRGGEFVFSGAITREPGRGLRAAVAGWLRKLIPALQLRGLCGIDLIAPARAGALLLEINPRPPASWPLHIPWRSAGAADAAADEDECSDAFSWHLRGCQRRLGAAPEPGPEPETGRKLRAMRHLFADRTGWLPRAPGWPGWVVNPPSRGRCYRPGEPLCTVLAEGRDEQQTLAALQRRCRYIRCQLQQQPAPAPLRKNNA